MTASPPGSPQVAPPEKDYDLSNLPPEAFAGQDPGFVEEPEIVPKILSLPLKQTSVLKDTEKDTEFENPIPKETSLSTFATILPPKSLKLLDSRSPKLRITALNEIQTKLEEMENSNDWSDAIYRGLEKSPGFAQSNVQVAQLMLDIFRHVFVKASEHIKKSTVAILVPFLVDKLSDRKLKSPIRELVLMIAEAICPSFIIQQFGEYVSGVKGNKVPAPKTVASALELCVECVQTYGLGDFSAKEYIPHLMKLLEFKTTDVKGHASTIACHLFKKFGDPFKSFLDGLNDATKNRVFGEFEKAGNLPEPPKKYLRQRQASAKAPALKPKEIPRAKLSKSLDADIDAALSTKKWTEQAAFCDAVSKAISDSKNCIFGNDLDQVMAVLKQYTTGNNKNLNMRSFVVLEQLARASDKDITKYVSSIATNIVAGWSDTRANVREQATKTIDAFVVHATPSPFIRVFSGSSFKTSNENKGEIIKWIYNHLKELSHGDMEKVVPIVVQCLDDRVSTTRQVAVQVAMVVKGAASDLFESHLKKLPSSSQRIIASYFEAQTTAQASKSQEQATIPKEVASPAKRPTKAAAAAAAAAAATVEKVEEKTPQELPRYASIPTLAKKTKRLRNQPSKLGLSMIANKQTLSTAIEKVKYDAQATLPASVFQKMSSNVCTDQIEGLQEMKNLYADDAMLVWYCSDIFVRWLATKLFDKNIKFIIEGINFLMMIFSEEQISLQEMEVIVPMIFWCVDSKPQIADSTLDLLFIVRTHSDPAEYSSVLRSCLDTCSVVSLVHLFSELQFTVTEDPRNSSIFTEIVAYADHKSIEVAASCGGVLSMLARKMTEEEKEMVLENLTPDQRDAISSVIPIEPKETVDFEGFNTLLSLDKIKLCRKLLEQLKTKTAMVQSSADLVLYSLLQELSCQETDWSSMKFVLFSLHSLLIYCTLKVADLKKTLFSVTFFANRWQRKLVLMDGISQTINSILFKLFEKISPVQLFQTLLEGMATMKGPIPADSFYCKCWIAITNQLTELMEGGDTPRLISMATEQLDEVGMDDIRGKLCNALILTLSGKKPHTPKKDTTPRAKQSLSRTSPVKGVTPVKKEAPVSSTTMRKSPAHQSSTRASITARAQVPGIQSRAAAPAPAPEEKPAPSYILSRAPTPIEEKPVPEEKPKSPRVSAYQKPAPVPRKSPVTKTAADAPAAAPTSSKDRSVSDLKEKLKALKSRWSNNA